MSGDVEECFLGILEPGGFSWLSGFVCVLALLPDWYYGMELTSLSSVLFVVVYLQYGERSRRDFY